MKKCPYCAEEIQDEAKKCRFCEEWVDKYTTSDVAKKEYSPTHGDETIIKYPNKLSDDSKMETREDLSDSENEDCLKYLSENERNELKTLDDPRIEYLVSPMNIMLPHFFNSKIGINDIGKRVIELRIKMRMNKNGLDPKINIEEYKKIKIEEEKRIHKRIK